MKHYCSFLLTVTLGFAVDTSAAFEGCMQATLTRGAEAQTFRYLVGPNIIRVERTETNWPHPANLIDRNTGAITLLFPHNRSYVRLNDPAVSTGKSNGPELSVGLPPGVGPQSSTLPGAPSMPAWFPPSATTMRPIPGRDQLELRTTGERTNLLGYTCVGYELKLRGEVMAIWATDQLVPYEPWLQNQRLPFGPRRIEEQFGELLKAKKLFPLRATLHLESGAELMRFEVKVVTTEKISAADAALLQPPADYHPLQPLSF